MGGKCPLAGAMSSISPIRPTTCTAKSCPSTMLLFPSIRKKHYPYNRQKELCENRSSLEFLRWPIGCEVVGIRLFVIVEILLHLIRAGSIVGRITRPFLRVKLIFLQIAFIFSHNCE